jgi:hypothetical protein
MDWFMGKRRKDKELTSPAAGAHPPPAVTPTNDDAKPYLDDDFTQERIIDIDLLPLVLPPYGVDYNEWLATHTLSFFEHINLVYGCVSEYCQFTACTTMTGPGSIQYQWIDDRGKKCKCTAPQYVDYVMSYSQKCIYDETIFPTKYGNPFPSSFETTVKKIHRLLLHVLAHVYQCHWRHLAALRLHGHMNTLAYHFLLFNRQFSLIDDKEAEVLDDLFDRLRLHATSSRRAVKTGGTAQQCDVDGDNDALAVAMTPDTIFARLLTDESNKENMAMTAAVGN